MNDLRFAALLTVFCLTSAGAQAAGRDPFRSPFVGTNAAIAATGLEAFELAALQVEGIISGIDSPRAVVVLPTGEAIVVKEGTAIGTRGGRVRRIERDAIVVAERSSTPGNRDEETRMPIR